MGCVGGVCRWGCVGGCVGGVYRWGREEGRLECVVVGGVVVGCAGGGCSGV